MHIEQLQAKVDESKRAMDEIQQELDGVSETVVDDSSAARGESAGELSRASGSSGRLLCDERMISSGRPVSVPSRKILRSWHV